MKRLGLAAVALTAGTLMAASPVFAQKDTQQGQGRAHHQAQVVVPEAVVHLAERAADGARVADGRPDTNARTAPA